MKKKIIALSIILLALTTNVAKSWVYTPINIINGTGTKTDVQIFDKKYQKIYSTATLKHNKEKKEFILTDCMEYKIRWTFTDNGEKVCKETSYWTTSCRDMEKYSKANLFYLYKNSYDVHGPWLFKKRLGVKATSCKN